MAGGKVLVQMQVVAMKYLSVRLRLVVDINCKSNSFCWHLQPEKSGKLEPRTTDFPPAFYP